MFRRLCAWLLIAVPLTAFAAPSKEIQELQRDIATLQELIKNLQKSQDQMLQSQNEKFAALQVLVQQSFTAANNADKAVAVIQSTLQQSAKDQESKLLPPVVQLSSRMDSMANDFRGVQQSVGDLTSLIDKIRTQLTDLNAAIKVMQAPPAAPPPVAGNSPAPAGPGDQPSLSATEMLANARADRGANHLDLALRGYADYVKYYGDSPQAAEAMFYIGYIHASQKEYEAAIKDFDAVVERFPDDSVRAPQSLLQKGLALLKLNRKGEASQAFRDAYVGYPKSSSAQSACDELQKLNYNCSAAKGPAKTPAKSSKKK
jgi:TolA-binding protein